MPLPPAKLARTDLCGVNCIQQGLRLLAVHLTQGNWRLQVCLVALGQDLLLHVLIAAICPERVVGILCCIQVPAQDSNCKETHTVQCVEPSRLWAVQEQHAHLGSQCAAPLPQSNLRTKRTDLYMCSPHSRNARTHHSAANYSVAWQQIVGALFQPPHYALA